MASEPLTRAAASVERCHVSWWSTSATAQPSRVCSWALTEERSLRLSFRLWASGKCRWIVKSATYAATAGRPLGGLELALHLPRLEDLEHVALADVGEARQHDAALEPGQDLADIVVDPPQRPDRGLPDDGAVADDPHARVAAHDAVADVGAGDRADPRGAEGLADLDGADRVLDLLGREHALHGGAQLVQRLVDHRVVADRHALAVGELAGGAHGPDVEADDDRLRRRRQHDVGLRDPADAAMD